VLYVNDDYGRGVRRTFAAEFTRLGGTMVGEDPALSTTRSLEPYLSRLARRGGVDVLVLAIEPPLAELALREMAGLGLRWPLMGSDALTEFTSSLPEGMYVSTAYLVDRPGARNAAFVEAYHSAFEGRSPDQRGAGTYDALHLLAHVIDAAGPDRRAIRNELARVGQGQPAFEGVTGTIAFDDRGDVATKPVVIGVVRNGQLVSHAGP
jgi:branched-chain amino acid transport system substrate-binding protein